MLDEIRGHMPEPTEEERDWMANDAVGTVARALVMAGVAMMIGVTAAYVVEQVTTPGPVASAPAK